MPSGLRCPGPRVKPYPPDGFRQVYRQPRSQPRVWSPRDAARIATYAACHYPPRQVMCAVFAGLGVLDDITIFQSKVEQAKAAIEAITPERGTGGEPWQAALDGLVGVVAAFILALNSAISGNRFVRWILRRVLILSTILKLLAKAAEMILILRELENLLIEVSTFLNEVSCTQSSPTP